jgi:hypothetical protein
MAIVYYDHILGRERVKPRYKWATVAFCIGLLAGFVCAKLV